MDEIKKDLIGQLSSGIAHEINSPIGFIDSNLQTFEKYTERYTQALNFLNSLEKAIEDKDEDEVKKIMIIWKRAKSENNYDFMQRDIADLLEESREGVKIVKKFVADMRSFAKADQLAKESVDLAALTDSMLNIVRNEIKYKAQLIKEYGQVPLVICNPQMVGQALVSVLINAARSIEKKGIITVRIYAKDQCVGVDITETEAGQSQGITAAFMLPAAGGDSGTPPGQLAQSAGF